MLYRLCWLSCIINRARRGSVEDEVEEFAQEVLLRGIARIVNALRAGIGTADGRDDLHQFAGAIVFEGGHDATAYLPVAHLEMVAKAALRFIRRAGGHHQLGEVFEEQRQYFLQVILLGVGGEEARYLHGLGHVFGIEGVEEF